MEGQIDIYFWTEFHPRRGLTALALKVLWHNYTHRTAQLEGNKEEGKIRNISIINSCQFWVILLQTTRRSMSSNVLKFIFRQVRWAKYKEGIEGDWVKRGVCIWASDLRNCKSESYRCDEAISTGGFTEQQGWLCEEKWESIFEESDKLKPRLLLLAECAWRRSDGKDNLKDQSKLKGTIWVIFLLVPVVFVVSAEKDET